jgi:pimeloyl-ACP methyl ester carboxylesterase
MRDIALSRDAEAWRRRGQMVRVRGVGVFVVDAGPREDGRAPIVLLHGFPTSSYDFHRSLGALSAARRVIALDFPGYGFSDKPPDYSYSLLEQADAVEVVLRELGVARAHLIAHDMGTSVATELCARREAGLLTLELASLVLMNGSVHIELSKLRLTQKLLLTPIVGPLFARLASRRLFKRQMRRIFGQRSIVDDQELDDLFALIRIGDGHLRLPQLMGYVPERYKFSRRWIGALERFDLPALILWGARDPVAVLAIGERLAVEIPRARLVRMDDLGHYPQLEDAARVARELNAFVESVER